MQHIKTYGQTALMYPHHKVAFPAVDLAPLDPLKTDLKTNIWAHRGVGIRRPGCQAPGALQSPQGIRQAWGLLQAGPFLPLHPCSLPAAAVPSAEQLPAACPLTFVIFVPHSRSHIQDHDMRESRKKKEGRLMAKQLHPSFLPAAEVPSAEQLPAACPLVLITLVPYSRPCIEIMHCTRESCKEKERFLMANSDCSCSHSQALSQLQGSHLLSRSRLHAH